MRIHAFFLNPESHDHVQRLERFGLVRTPGQTLTPVRGFPFGRRNQNEFDAELRRSTFQRASENVRQEQSLKTWQAFWSTAIDGNAPAVVAQELGMSIGAVRVAKCRVLARLKEVVFTLENES